MNHKQFDTDDLARNLMRMGAIARAMPPAWDGAGIAHMAAGPGGEYFGKMLPGRGLYVDMDLSRFGINRHLPNVFERSITQYLVDEFMDRRRGLRTPLLDRLASERGAITTYDGIINARAGGKAFDVSVSKLSVTTVANVWSSLFQSGGFPAAGTYTAIPGGAAMSNASTGAWSFGLINPTSPDKKYLLTLGFVSSSQLNVVMLVDLLVAAGAISANLNTTQTINSAALTRYTSGSGVLMTCDVTTGFGATPADLTVSNYTDQDGTPSQSTAAIAMTPSAIAMRLQPTELGPFMRLAAGDFGVRSVQTAILSAAMGAGAFALNLYFPLCFVPGIVGNAYIERDSTVQIDGLTQLVTAAGGVLGCLTAYVLPNGTTSGQSTWFMRTCDG